MDKHMERAASAPSAVSTEATSSRGLVRDTRGQAFSDYLIVIALVAVMVVAVSGPAKQGATSVISTVFSKITSVVGNFSL